MEMKWGWTGDPATIEDIKNDVREGWNDILTRLVADLENLGWDGVVYQVKEKFGMLCFYIGDGNEEIWKRLDQAEKESMETCQNCGKPGKISSWDKWWMLCLCPECGEKVRESKPQMKYDQKRFF